MQLLPVLQLQMWLPINHGATAFAQMSAQESATSGVIASTETGIKEAETALAQGSWFRNSSASYTSILIAPPESVNAVSTTVNVAAGIRIEV
jgi:hypothetical protein